MATITMSEARAMYTAGNNAGRGYAPYADVPGDDTVAAAVTAAEADGWDVELRAQSTDDVTVLRNADGERMAIGGDARGRNAWAVIISDA